ncbi:ESPR-type extended signal peptide-containing protein, partial [Psychrobacter celer]|uniref:ESPR-type extended signal peptide-containing protein n=1 Tax=Psychrobacter celer TaxID=306572 RepID=UPI003FD16BFF
MNRNYKVIWNRSLGCFTAVAEYAKSRGKSSSTVSSTSIASAAVSSGAKLLRLSALSVGLVSAGFSVQSVAGYEAGGGTTAISCTRDSNGGYTEAASIAIGNGVTSNIACAPSIEAIAIGANLAAQGEQSTVIGNDIVASPTAIQAVVIGSNFNANPTTSTGQGGVAIGSGLTTTLDSPVANGVGSVAIGSSGNGTTNSLNGANASGNHALALMSGANASATDSIALGTSATANNANSVALGSGSTTAAYVRTQTGTVNGKTYTYAGTPATSSTVSIGASGTERTLTNLAAGRVSATSTDGINGSQLFQTNTELGNLAASTASALGGSSAAGTAAGGITAPNYTITKTDGTNYGAANNVGTALSNLNTEVIKSITFTGNSGSSTRKLGETLAISGGLAGASSNSNVKTVVTGNTVDIQIANAPVFTGQVKANGFDASGAKIINVAKGTNATDAVNFSQLAESELTSSVVAGNNTSVSSATTGNNTAYTVNAKKSTVSAGSTAVAVTPGTETNDTTNYAVDLSAATKTSLGKADTAVQTISSNDSNLTAVKTGSNVTFDFADAPVFTGQVKASGFDASGAKIINVVDGSVAANSQDAIN